jgi:hypothetical protein
VLPLPLPGRCRPSRSARAAAVAGSVAAVAGARSGVVGVVATVDELASVAVAVALGSRRPDLRAVLPASVAVAAAARTGAGTARR